MVWWEMVRTTGRRSQQLQFGRGQGEHRFASSHFEPPPPRVCVCTCRAPGLTVSVSLFQGQNLTWGFMWTIATLSHGPTERKVARLGEREKNGTRGEQVQNVELRQRHSIIFGERPL
jgi:hypothetical protein